MPIYAYACKKCEHTLDALQKIADEPLVVCPECGLQEMCKRDPARLSRAHRNKEEKLNCYLVAS